MGNKLLLIDDDDNIRENIAMFLEDIGFTVYQSNNGTHALPLVREHRPDLIFCDLVMPPLSGIKILKQIKMEFPNQKIIIMSGLHEEGTAREAIELGASEYITKPISLAELEAVLKRYFPDPVI